MGAAAQQATGWSEVSASPIVYMYVRQLAPCVHPTGLVRTAEIDSASHQTSQPTHPHTHTVLVLVEPSKGKRRPDDRLPEEIVLDRPSIVIGACVPLHMVVGTDGTTIGRSINWQIAHSTSPTHPFDI